MTPGEASSRRARTVAAYVAMVAAAVAVFLMIRARGVEFPAPPAAEEAHARAAGGEDTFARVLLSLALITVATRLVGSAFQRFLRQPPVMGEIVAGILLGPSLLGACWPAAQAFVLPAAVAPHLAVISKIGVVLFLFLVGLELEPRLLRKQPHATVAISHASILAPFLLGAALALYLYPTHATRDVDFTTFALFLAVALSVTAFPVLARILSDRGVQSTPLGTTALACAAIDDVTAWTLLAFLTALARAELAHFTRTVLLLALYVAVMYWVVRPAVRLFSERAERGHGPLSRGTLALVFVAVLLSAVATEWIGVHALFGAFLLGVLLPRGGRLAREVQAQLESFVLVLLLPSFFALTGLRMEIGLLDGVRDWLVCALILLAATLGKVGGTTVAARLTGHRWRPALALGFLMNTRGLMQLIVLDLGLELGLITRRVFTMMVLMALVTTFLTAPAVERVLGKRWGASGS